MPTIAIIWIGIMLLISVAVFYFSQKQKKKYSSIDLEQEKRNAPSYQQEMLNEEYAFLKKWIKEAPIDAFTSASLPISLADHAKSIGKMAAKTIAFAAVGVKARYRQVETFSYVVLSNGDLHYFGTNVDGELDEHVLLDAFILKSATLQYKGVKKPKTALNVTDSQDLFPEIYELSFDSNGKTQTIEIHDRLTTSPDALSVFNGNYNKMFIKNKVVGNLFTPKLVERYPNLKANKI
jgi:hypothetical protein